MEYFLARQPIFSRDQKVYGYELSFRQGFSQVYEKETKDDHQLSKVIDEGFMHIGIKTLTGGKKAFIRFTRNLLINGIVTLLPNEILVVQIGSDIYPDEKVLNACYRMKNTGYPVALDDFVYQPDFMPFLNVIDIAKVDFSKSGEDALQSIHSALNSKGIKSLLTNVDSKDVFDQGREIGYDYFQGNFFSKPFVIAGRNVHGYKLNYLRILKEVHQADSDFTNIEKIIKQDVSLSYKLLRLINSAAFGTSKEIKSIKQALVMLGLREVKKWITIVALSGMATDKPEELIQNALTRAKFCELLANISGLQNVSSELFLMGMFSLIDALVDQPMASVLEQLPLSTEIKSALTGEPSPYKDIYNLVQQYEIGDWEEVAKRATGLKIDTKKLPSIFLKSTAWVNDVLN